jgi:hypothetical protein
MQHSCSCVSGPPTQCREQLPSSVMPTFIQHLAHLWEVQGGQEGGAGWVDAWVRSQRVCGNGWVASWWLWWRWQCMNTMAVEGAGAVPHILCGAWGVAGGGGGGPAFGWGCVGTAGAGRLLDRRAEVAEPGSQGPVLKGGREVWRGPGGGGWHRGLEGLPARGRAQACQLQPPLVPGDENPRWKKEHLWCPALPGRVGRLGCSAGGINTGVRPGG